MARTKKHSTRKHSTRKHSTRKHKSKKGGSLIDGLESKDVIVGFGDLGQINSGAKLGLKGGNPKKGQKSKTMKGKKDFTTKKTSKYFNRKGHRQTHAQGSKKHRRPFRKHKGGELYALGAVSQISDQTGVNILG